MVCIGSIASIKKTIGEVIGVVRDDEIAIGMQVLNVKTIGGDRSFLSALVRVASRHTILDLAIENEHTFYVDNGGGAILVYKCSKPVYFPDTAAPNTIETKN